MKIIWTQEDLEKLTEIEDYISRDSPERAPKFINRIIAHTSLLHDQPRSAPEISNSDIRELLYKL